MTNANSKTEPKGFRGYMKKKDIEISFERIAIQAMGAMAHGLFASLLLGTICDTLGMVFQFEFFSLAGDLCAQFTGAAIAVAIGYGVGAPPFVLYSLVAVGQSANALGGAGGPLAVFFVALVAIFAGKLVSKTTPCDLLVTPLVTSLVGIGVASVIAPPIGAAANSVGLVIMWATEQQPFIMGILVSVIVGVVLTLPISSAAICAGLGLVGLAGGAALAGSCAQGIVFAIISYRDNGVGGLLGIGLGTSMLQVPNLMRKPILWLPAVCASAISGPVATCIFQLKQNGAPVISGMGMAGLSGPIGALAGWFSPSKDAIAIGEAAIHPGAFDWLGFILCVFVINAVVGVIVAEVMRKFNLIEPGDLKVEC